MELKLTFNTDPESYERYRARYSKVLFDDLINYSGLDQTKKAVEIGIGTGQATKAILETSCDLTAIEIGDQLAAFVKDKFSSYTNIKVINQDFESVPLEEEAYDLIYSASAFHWIPLDLGMKRVIKLLKKHGVFAWISTTPMPSDDHEHIYDEIQKVYVKYNKYFDGNTEKRKLSKIGEDINTKLRNRTDTFKDYTFTDVESSLYLGSRTFTAEEYVQMASTFSDHKVIPSEERHLFFQEIVDVINGLGGKFTLTDRYLLTMGRKA